MEEHSIPNECINNKQKKDKSKIIAIITSAIAICSISFGIYSLIQLQDKNAQISNLETKLNSQDTWIRETETESDSIDIQSWIDNLITDALAGQSDYKRIRIPSYNYIYYKPEYLLSAIPSSGECFGVLIESSEPIVEQLLKDVKQKALEKGLEEIPSDSMLNDNGGIINRNEDFICELSNETMGSSAYSDYHNRFVMECVKISENFPQKGTQSDEFKIDTINELAESYKDTVGNYPVKFLANATSINTTNKKYIRKNNETYEILNIAVDNPYSGDYFYKKSEDKTWIYTSCTSNGELLGENAAELFVCKDYHQMIKGDS